METFLVLLVVLAVLVVLAGAALLAPRLSRRVLPKRRPAPPVERRAPAPTAERPTAPSEVGEPPTQVAEPPTQVAEPPTEVVEPPVEAPVEVEEPVAPPLERPEPTAGRLTRLRARLARSESALGRGLLGLLSRDRLDEEAWEEIEDTLLTADVGVAATTALVERLRERTRVLGTRTTDELRAVLADELVTALDPELDRRLAADPVDGKPAVLLVVGVNGSGKTTTCGKVARVLVADGHSVVLERPTRSGPRRRISSRPGLVEWGPRWCAARRGLTRPAWRLTRSAAVSRWGRTRCWSTPPVGCRPRSG